MRSALWVRTAGEGGFKPRSHPSGRRKALSRLRQRDDIGFTLVEVLVAVVIIIIVLVPFAIVFYNTLNAAASNGSRQNGSVLGTSVLSDLQSIGYSNVGFASAGIAAAPTSYGAVHNANNGNYYWNHDGDTDLGTFTGSNDASGDAYNEQLVTTTSTPSFTVGSSATAFAPVMTNVRSAGTIYTVVTHIVWSSTFVQACPGQSPSTTVEPQAYKRVYLTISWSNSNIQSQSLSMSTLMYPGGLSPYTGPAYNSSQSPVLPGTVTATATTVAGQVTVSWTYASSFTGCFDVAWSNNSNVGSSTGMLQTSQLTSSTSGGLTTYSYTVSGLSQGGAQQAYTFYVTADSANGVEETESTDTPAADAPNGPVITSVIDSVTNEPWGKGVELVNITGTGFTLGPINIFFCPTTVACTASWATASCPYSAPAKFCVTGGCTSTTACTATTPTSPGVFATGIYEVIAETPTGSNGAEITSPPTAGAQFTYQPRITSDTQTASGGVTTVTAINGVFLYPGTTFSLNGTVYPATCTNSGTSCTFTAPQPTFATGTAVTAVGTDLLAQGSYSFTA